MKNINIFVAILVAWFSIGVLQVSAESADLVIKDVSEKVIERINSQKTILEENPEKVYDLVYELIVPNFSFSSMSKWVLGKNWKKIDASQRDKFVEEFSALIIRTYSSALLKYSNQDIKVFPAEQKSNSKLAVVKTELSNPSDGKTLPVSYRMYKKKAETWKVIDVIVDGVSLVSTYRGSFAAKIKKEGFDALIANLIDKNKKLSKKLGGS